MDNIIDCILKNKDAIYDLLLLKGYDYYTYTHSVNVAIMSIGLGMAIELKTDDVEKLGIGAMLHDVGKSAMPYEILNKQGKLNDIEYKVLRSHVIEGEKILRAHKEIPEESFAAVIQHHEKLTGKRLSLSVVGK
ncbi:HD-GYP domain-containing protein [Dissulfurispira sp.]|uniref:HD-GYP domain-containing protein n=1 Tax=Dissulfurispira sp. TaxID=2817609 RepID=UPI002FD881ED